MNATPAVPQTPIASDPAQLSSAASANSVNSGGKDGDFAAALSKAGAKPGRKAAGHGPGVSGADGGQLPVAGNFSPPAAMAGAAAGAMSDRGAADRTGSNDSAGSTSTIGAAGAATISGADAKAAEQAGVSTESPAATDDRGAAGLAAGFSASMGLPAGTGEPGAPPADLGPLAEPGIAGTPLLGAMQDSRTAQNIPSVQELAPSTGAAAAGRPAATGNPARATLTATAASAANDAATSARSSAATGTVNGTVNGAVNGTVNGADASAQAASAAAIAVATGLVADNAASADATLSAPADLTMPAAGGAKGVAGANGAPAPGLMAAAARPAAAAQAASAAVQTESIGTNGADKHAGSDNGDSLLSDASAGAAGAAQFSVNPASATDAVAAPTLKVTAGVDTPEFGQGVADRVSWMVDNNLSSAKLQINPPQLGPIEVRISVQGDHAQVWLTSHSAVTRDALESGSPKLREMLGAQGFGQVSVDVSQRNFQDRSAHAQPYQWTPAPNLSSPEAVRAPAVSLPRLSSGAVDAYA